MIITELKESVLIDAIIQGTHIFFSGNFRVLRFFFLHSSYNSLVTETYIYYYFDNRKLIWR